MPRQVDHHNRRELIERAVLDIATECGFAAVTIRAVADHIGASTSAVTHYVGGREELLRNAVRREIDKRRQEGVQAMQGLDDRAALRALIEWAVLGPDARTHQLWLALVLGAATDPALRAELDRFNEWWSAQLRDRVARVCPDDPVGAADVLDVFVDGLILTGFDAGQPWPMERRARLLQTVWRALGL
ncbi:TetR family transcriptional regulator [Isoalcanivorax pacificus W11-5]|uniref:TetR family transcriptional regulator n=1 Tax=Isoalcanivorax pacificus W11-5 TaxID=391936 RepID=A0A0B4XRH9_9GAMM|nr:TetR family transcriptional regulator C-terminal domain-containing protein [Isoalcanivorax pacificus]AJD49811.1 TetR family transcriptional regulator [Isoalcanivorax pacificus W11-5]